MKPDLVSVHKSRVWEENWLEMVRGKILFNKKKKQRLHKRDVSCTKDRI